MNKNNFFLLMALSSISLSVFAEGFTAQKGQSPSEERNTGFNAARTESSKPGDNLKIPQNNETGEEQDPKYDDLFRLNEDKEFPEAISDERLKRNAYESFKSQFFAEPKNVRDALREQDEEDRLLYDNKELKAIDEIIPINTRPGAEPAVIKVAYGNATLLNFVDSTGQPWKVGSALPGNDNLFTASPLVNHLSGNVVRVKAEKRYGTTNLILSLHDLATTFHIILKVDKEEYHGVPVLQLDREGPSAVPIIATGLVPDNSDPVLRHVVLGDPRDSKYKKLKSSDPENVEGWTDGESLLLRTRYLPAAPLRAINHGIDGFKAYRVEMIPVITMITENGTEKEVRFEQERY